MKLTDLIETFEFHDGMIDYIKYDIENRVVLFDLELGNHEKRFTFEGKQPELITVRVSVENVNDIQINKTPFSLNNKWKKIDGEILTVQILNADNQTGYETIQFIIYLYGYNTKPDEVMEITITGDSVSWFLKSQNEMGDSS